MHAHVSVGVAAHGRGAHHHVSRTRVDGTVQTLTQIGRLPQRQRQALVLRYYADCTLHQVADLLGCPLGTAKSLIHRGLAALKGELLS